MNKYLSELVGTFALVFVGTGAVVVNATHGGAVTLVGVAVAFGLVVMTMIYAVGDVSGAHLNPAVTVGFWAAGRFPARQILPYVASQVAGAVLASAAVRLALGNYANLGATLPSGSVLQSFVFEVILTALLMFVIFSVACGAKEKGLMAGVAIGGVVAMEILCGGPVSGASMNPARSLGPAVVSGNMTALWVYLVAPTLGALVAVPCWYATRAPPTPAEPV